MIAYKSLQDAGRNSICIRDALETVREISNLITYSPKWLHLFSSKLSQASYSHSTVSLPQTRWTALLAAIEAILEDYEVLLEEVHVTIRDEYGLKGGGLLIAVSREIYYTFWP